jgi:D-alanyl-D-alanine carboxypeptidase
MRVLAACFGMLTVAPASLAATRLPGDPQGPYLLVDAETGEVLKHFDAQRPWFPASTTKLMTAYVAFRATLAGQITLQSPVTISANAAAQPASKMGFNPGATLTLEDALKVMMVKSANDIAVAVAETVGGSVEAFAKRMNEEAARLGMSRSHFVNPHGLPDERQVTTARDMAVLAKALLVEFPQHRDFLKVHAFQLGDKVFKNFNPLLERYPGANGMKTGFICASGYNLVASARRGKRELIAVVFGEYGGKARAEHAAELLDAGFAAPAARSLPRVTLAGVASGKSYTSPFDMRPFVCSPDRAAAASEANMEDGEKKGEAEEKVSHLTAPIYLGPPVPVDVTDPNARPGELGYAARIPRPRPELPEIADAYAPVADAPGAAEKAIEESAEEKPLLHLYSN